jgi:hypothetical protein
LDFRQKGVDWKVKVGANKLTKFCMFHCKGRGSPGAKCGPLVCLFKSQVPTVMVLQNGSTFLYLATMCIQGLRGLLGKVDRREVACWRYERCVCKGWKSSRNQAHHYSSIEDGWRILKFDWDSLHEGADRIESKGPSDPFILQTLLSHFYKKVHP